MAVDGIKWAVEQDHRLVLQRVARTADERAALVQLIVEFTVGKIKKAEFDAELAARLDPDRAERVRSALDDRLSWFKTQSIDERLRYAGAPLTIEQQDALRALFSSSVQEVPPPADNGIIAEAIRAKREANTQILAAAAAFLSPRQVQLMAARLEEEVALQHVGLFKMKSDLQSKAPRPAPK